MQRLIMTTFAVLLVAFPAFAADDKDRPIPQDPEKQRQRYVEMLAWNQRTLAGAYDKVGKKDPRWDKLARKALEAAAHMFSFSRDPIVEIEDLFPLAKEALDAGCDDPLVLYLYARSSHEASPEELKRRYLKAAHALAGSSYPPFRRAFAMQRAATIMTEQQNLTDQERQEAARLFDEAVALIPESVAKDELNQDMTNHWFEIATRAIAGHKKLGKDSKTAFERVDALLAKDPAVKATRLLVKGNFLIEYAWEARGNGFANTVTPEGWQKFGERLAESAKALEESWQLHPDPNAARFMIIVNMGLSGERDDMEKWFERAMKADGNNKLACEAKMNWLEPKWHGSVEDLLAFGRACRDTKNTRVGITLLVADAHRRIANYLPPDVRRKYLHSKEVWDDIHSVYEEYLKHSPNDNVNRSFYAAYCFKCGRYLESDKQFKIVGDKLAWTRYSFPEKWMKEVRDYVAAVAQEEEAKRKQKDKE